MIADPLIALAEGRPEGYVAILQNCRLEGFGSAAYGTEDIRALIQHLGFHLSDVVAVTTPTLSFVAGVDQQGAPAALVADVYDGLIVRLWGLSALSAPDPVAERVSAPFDLDMDQRGGQVAFEAADHPQLSLDHADVVRDLGGLWLRQPPEAVMGRLSRARPLVLRAASQDGRAAALYRIQGAGDQGLAGFYALALFDGQAEALVIVDLAGRQAALAAPWTPTLRSSTA